MIRDAGHSSSSSSSLHGDPPRHVPQNDAPPVSADVALATTEQPIADFAEAYRTFCAEDGCRCNSAVMAFLSKRGVNKPLDKLILNQNYVGPRGFRPVLRLIALCPTVEVIDLSGNGLDNDAVVALCALLDTHLGVTTLRLDRNPFTMDGGKAIMRLVENNRRITLVTVTSTAIFEALADRIRMATEENYRLLHNGERPVLLPSEDAPSQAMRPPSADAAASSSSAVVGLLVPRRPPPDELRLGAVSSRQPQSASRPVTLSVPERPSTSSLANTHKATSTVGSPHRTPANSSNTLVTSRKVRPPPPAIASDFHIRLNAEQRDELQRDYERRAAAFASVERSSARKALDDARNELAVLEAVDRRREAERDELATEQNALAEQKLDKSRSPVRGGGPYTLPVATRAAVPPGQDGSPSKRSRPTHSRQARVVTAQELAEEGSAVAAEEEPQPAEVAAPPETTEPTSTVPLPEENVASTTAADPPVVPAAATRPEDSVAKASGTLLVTAEEQFRALFQLGAQQYQMRQLDAAYAAWNEAMSIAVKERNREWTAVLTQNLQGLSFELLVEEAHKFLQNRELDESDKALDLALRIAQKARNASWEADAQKIRKQVLQHRFQSLFDVATSRFEQLTVHSDVDVTDDDRFEDPTTGKLVQHSGMYVNEWQRMLLVKEAVERWADATLAAKSIGGQSGRVLQEVVVSSAMGLCKVQLKRYYETPDDPRALTSQRTWGLSRKERESLIELWRDLQSKSRSMECELWNIIEAGQLGQLHFASYELSSALVQFLRMNDIASQLQEPFFQACALLYCSRVFVQRGDYAEAERVLKSAMSYIQLEIQRLASKSASGKNRTIAALIDQATKAQESGGGGASQPQAPSPRRPSQDASGLEADEDAADADGGAIRVGGKTLDEIVKDPNASVASVGHAMQQPDAPRTVMQQWQEFQLDPLVVHHTHYAILAALSQLYTWREDHRAALQLHERALLYKRTDVLQEKILANFTNTPTVDHIVAVSGAMHGAPLVYLSALYRHDFNAVRMEYETHERLVTWVVPSEGDLKCVITEITQSYGLASLRVEVDLARRTLCVHTDEESGWERPIGALALLEAHDRQSLREQQEAAEHAAASRKRDNEADIAATREEASRAAMAASASGLRSSMVSLQPDLAWKKPLRSLYEMVMAPIVDYLVAKTVYRVGSSSMDAESTPDRDGSVLMNGSDTNAANNYGSSSPAASYRQFIIIPDGFLWLLPFHCLMDAKGQFMMDRFVISHAFSAMQLSYSGLCAVQVHGRPGHRRVVIGQPEAQGASIVPYLPFPLDQARAAREASVVAEATHAEIITGSSSDFRGIPRALTTARTIYCCTPVLSNVSRAEDASRGGIAATTSYDHLGVLHTGDIAAIAASGASLMADLCMFTNANVDVRSVSGSPREGALDLCSAILGAGCSCVVLPIWCTPDMTPSDFSLEFFMYLSRLGEGDGALLDSRTGKAPSVPSASLASRADALTRAMRSSSSDSSASGAFFASGMEADDGAAGGRRAMPSGVRRCPRLWGGYMLIGAPVTVPKTAGARSATASAADVAATGGRSGNVLPIRPDEEYRYRRGPPSRPTRLGAGF